MIFSFVPVNYSIDINNGILGKKQKMSLVITHEQKNKGHLLKQNNN